MGLAGNMDHKGDRPDRDAHAIHGGDWERYFVEALDAGRHIMYCLNFRENRYDYISRGIEEVLGFTAEEVMQMGPEDSIRNMHPEDWPRLERKTGEWVAEAMQNAGRCRIDIEYRRQHKDGTYRWMRDCGTFFVDAQGNIDRLVGAIYDITEERRAQEEVRQSKEFIEKTLNAIEDAFFVKDEEHRWVFLNDAAVRVMGRPREELIGKSDYDLFDASQAEVFWERDNRVLETGRTDVNEEEITWHGKLHYIMTTKSLLVDSRTGKKYITGTVRDISDRKRIELELRDRKELFDEALGNSQHVLYRLNFQTGVYDYLSPSVEGLVGWTCEELKAIGVQGAMEHIHPEDLPRVSALLEEARQRAKDGVSTVRLEYRRRTKSGDYIWFSDWGTLFYDEQGNLLRGMGSAYDITDRKRLEEKLLAMHVQLERRVQERTEALAVSEEKYRMLAEHTQDLVALLDMAFRVQYISPSWERVTGWRQEDFTDQSAMGYVHPTDIDYLRQEVEELTRSGSRLSEWRLRCKNGEYLWVETNATLIRNEAGDPIRMLCSLRDITERKRMERMSLLQRELGVELSASRGLNDSLNCIVDTVMQIDAADCAGIFIFNEDRSVLEMKASRNVMRDFADMPTAIIEGDERWEHSHRTQLITFRTEDLDFEVCRKAKERGYRWICLVPILEGYEQIGLVAVFSKSEEGFSETAVVTLESICSQIGGVILRTRAEDALREAQNLFSSFMDSIPAGVTIKNTDGVFQYANHFMGMLFPRQKDFMNSTSFDFLPPDLAERIRAHDQQALVNGLNAWEEWIPDGGGSNRCHRIYKFPIRRPGGSPLIGGISLEVTDQKIAERLLRLQRDLNVRLSSSTTSQEAFAHILDALMQIDEIDMGGIYLLDEKREFLDLAAWRNLSETFRERLDHVPVSLDFLHDLMNGKVVTGNVHHVADAEIDIARDEGYQAFCIVPIRQGERIIGTLNAASSNLSEFGTQTLTTLEAVGSQVGGVIVRTQIEAALRRSEATARVLLNAPKDIAILTDREGRIITFNEQAARSMGVTPDSLAGVKVFEVFDPETGARRKAMGEQIIATGQPGHFEDTRNGRVFVIDIYPVFDGQGNVDRLAIYSSDVTEERRIEDELRRYQDRMRRVEQLASLGTLSATLAHELNQPLTVMQLYLQQCRRHLGTGEVGIVNDKVDYCLTELGRAGDIVRRFRDFARKSSPDEISKIDPCQAARRIVSALREAAGRRKVDLNLHCSGTSSKLTANPSDLEQIFFVLIQNSIQAADGIHSRQVNIEVVSGEKNVVIAVGDTCGGVPDEDMAHIFEPFFTTKPQQEGTGLGLCILDRIVKKYSGMVAIDNDFGYGITFRISLPLE